MTAALVPVVVAVSLRAKSGIDWGSFAVVLVAALVTPLFGVKGVRQQWFLASGAVCVMAALLLPAAPALAAPLVASLVDWIRRRYLPGNSGTLAGLSAFANGITYMWATLAASVVVAIAGTDTSSILIGLTPLLAVLAFVLISEMGFAFYISLGWGHRFGDLFVRESLAIELAVSSSGAGAAVLWLLNPWYALLVIAPIAMARSAQRVPSIEAEATLDAKTRLLNSVRFMQEFQDELERASRRQLPLTILLADLDFLRDVNNDYGHLAGDAIISGFADAIRSGLRRSDFAGRFGGEEFVILLSATTRDEGTAVGERIRRAFAAQIFRVEGREQAVRSTVSIGLATYPEDGETSHELIHAADAALYEAKATGRNRLVCADPAIGHVEGVERQSRSA